MSGDGFGCTLKNCYGFVMFCENVGDELMNIKVGQQPWTCFFFTHVRMFF